MPHSVRSSRRSPRRSSSRCSTRSPPPTATGLGINIIADKPSTYIDFAAVITAAINFLIVAAVVYFVIVLPLKALKERRKRGEEAGPAEPTDVQLLSEIRDLLAAQAGASDGKHSPDRRQALPPTDDR